MVVADKASHNQTYFAFKGEKTLIDRTFALQPPVLLVFALKIVQSLDGVAYQRNELRAFSTVTF